MHVGVDAAVERPPAGARADSGTALSPCVLLIDDAPEAYLVLRDAMGALCAFEAARSGPEGLARADADPQPDLILLDVCMPEMGGFEVLRNLRANPRTAGIPVIFLTGVHDEASELRALSAGAVDYVNKPLRPPVVLARVRAQLDLKFAREALQNDNHYLEAEVARRTRESRLVRDVSIRALANLADVRDNETGAHMVDSTGRRNTFDIGGVYGKACGVDAGIDRAWSDALTRCAVTSPANRAAILGADCNRDNKREGGRDYWRISSGRYTLVPSSRRDAIVYVQAYFWKVFVVF